MARATLRFYAELNDFLPTSSRQTDLTLGFAAPAPVRHLVECCGVPHTEVELVMRDGVPLDLESPVADGDRLAVFPVFEALGVRPGAGSQRVPRFVADAHLGRLARQLRMLGFDTLWKNDYGDERLVDLSAGGSRILLTRDRRLLMRRKLSQGCFVREGSTRGQLAYLMKRLSLCAAIRPLSRCMLCNAELTQVPLAAVRAQIPTGVIEMTDAYWRCPGCGRVYWRGSHWRAMRVQIAQLCGQEPVLDPLRPAEDP